MGGRVAVTLREPDGTEHRMVRWTNSMPFYICNTKMLRADREHIDEYLSQWRLMKDDWERNHKTGKFEHNMTDFYVPYDGNCLYPQGYGLVVVDLKENQLLSYQGYTNFTQIGAARIQMETRPRGIMPSVKEEKEAWQKALADPNSDLNRLKAFYDEGRIDSIGNWTGDPTVEYSVPTDFENLRIVINNMQGWVSFNLDLRPLTVADFNDYDIRSARVMYKFVQENFELSEEEEAGWQDHFRELEEHMAELEEED